MRANSLRACQTARPSCPSLRDRRHTQTIESLAIREGKSERSIRMTLSLAFICPVLAEAAMGGRVPRGFCIKRLTDLPMLWSERWGRIGLQAPAQVRAELS